MSCEICSLDTSVDSVMWSCVGCVRKFHAACVGITVQRSSLRKRDKKVVDVTSYVLPCCDSCQQLLQMKFDLSGLVDQQKALEKQLQDNTEVLYKLTLQHEKPNVVHEAIEGLELLLSSVKNELSAIHKSSSLAGSVTAIKNHTSTVCDWAMTETAKNVQSTIKALTSELSTDLRNINNEINQLNQLSVDTAASLAMHSNAMLEVDILDELKAISASLMVKNTQDVDSSPPSLETHPSLEAELKEKSSEGNKYMEFHNDDPKWRVLGEKWTWKPDWSDHDYRESQKQQKRQKNKKSSNSNGNGRHKFNVNYKNHSKYNNNSSNNNNGSNNRNHNCNSKNRNHHHNGITFPQGQRGTNFLPPDRILLAAAKERFSKPPHWHQPIQFQRGEILNPYPADGVPPRPTRDWCPNGSPGRSSYSSCDACSAPHSCFRRH